ncbi:molybdopterin-dependent oxidoreductase [Paraburkholderia sp. UCT31]|uniref:molybdopterin-dependent oxidoreductase n=1 Tax=Paraburkholderia sp. UCT31 TaxID=2615209 RepID=UPI0016562356|nr:molybdopterin-dependent oxidoreductase [Paraburkholderia sp. UCT31]MBC8738582.1 molybdopterin-dependent oxidoreductase [Paraburkholderia sp. UCT31]
MHLLARNALCAAAALCALSSSAFADETFLTVSGNITAGAKSGSGHKVSFTQAQFDALPQTTVSTSTSWTKGVHVFRGPLLRDLQKAVGASGTTMNAYAIDDYMQGIPVSDFTKYNVILADTMDGKPLPPDHYGPTWVIYPRDQFPELVGPLTDGKFVWQVNRVVFK